MMKRNIFQAGSCSVAALYFVSQKCGVNRFERAKGYCGTDAGLNIASICIHRERSLR